MRLDHFNSDKYQYTAFFYLLNLSVASSLLFLLVNLYNQKYTLSAAILGFALISIALLIAMRKNGFAVYFKLICRLYLAVFYSFIILCLVFVPTVKVTMFSFIFLIPCVSYLLLGQRWGMIYSGVFSVIALVVYLLKFSVDANGSVNVGVIGNLSLCLITVWLFSQLYEQSKEQSKELLIKKASEDSLTKLKSQSMLNVLLPEDHQNSIEHGQSLSIAIIDIDWFRMINHNYGYHLGDLVLCSVADVIRKNIRHTDSAFRLGGEEFCISLPNTNLVEAHKLIEKIRTKIEQKSFELEGTIISLTISAGIAECCNKKFELNRLINEAGRCVHTAKKRGRNQIVLGET